MILTNLVQKGLHYYSENNPEGALEQFQSAFTLEPLNAETLNNIGVIYFKMGKIADALAYLEKAINVNPEYETAKKNYTSVRMSMDSAISKEANPKNSGNKNTTLSEYYNKPLKILFISQTFYPTKRAHGGAEFSALTMMKAFAEDGHHSSIICMDEDGQEFDYMGVKIVQIPSIDTLEAEFIKINPDIIMTHIHWSPSAIWLAKKYCKTSILFIRSYENICPDPIQMLSCKRDCEICSSFIPMRQEMLNHRFAVINADIVICDSEFTRSITTTFYNRKADLIYELVDINAYKVEKNYADFITMNQPEKHKGNEIFREIAKLMPEERFMTVGRGIHDASSPNLIHFGQTSPRIFYSHTKIMLVPSIWPEPFGRVVMEAMANGIPVISSCVGGLPEVVGNAGILIDDYMNPQKWVYEIKSLLQNPNLYKDMQKKGAEQVKKFEIKTEINKLRNLLEILVSN